MSFRYIYLSILLQNCRTSRGKGDFSSRDSSFSMAVIVMAALILTADVLLFFFARYSCRTGIVIVGGGDRSQQCLVTRFLEKRLLRRNNAPMRHIIINNDKMLGLEGYDTTSRFVVLVSLIKA
jgi:hypothetical protein